MPNFYEFFAGGGMVRAGLGSGWTCLFANDYDQKKAASYENNWGGAELHVGDVASVTSEEIPGRADLAWASFPCQDLSLAGGGAGLKGHRSGTFWPFWDLMGQLDEEGRAPKVIALENVCGTLTSHGGQDFAAIGEAFASLGYKFGAVVVDASLFVPQSRPRLFIIGVKASVKVPDKLLVSEPIERFHSKRLVQANKLLPDETARQWLWWRLPEPEARKLELVELLDHGGPVDEWHTADETQALLDMMSPLHLQKVEDAKATRKLTVGCIYKRMRGTAVGERVQRAEVRFDGIAGCLRTPAGGSSRQLVMTVNGDHVRSRLISARETARLMGLGDSYLLPESYNDAYHLTGDGVAVPVVRFLAKHVLEPLTSSKVYASETKKKVDEAA